MFRYVIAVLFCCPVLAIPSSRTEITYPSLETLRSGEKILTLRAFGNDIALKLESAGDVIADDFTFMEGDGKIHKTNVKNLKSKLFRNKEKNAALYINEEGPLEIKGLIASRMKIEPCASNEENKEGRRAHCITRRSEDDKRIYDAVIPPSINQIYSNDSLMVMQDNQCVVIDYFFVTESTFTHRFNNKYEIKVNLSMALMGKRNEPSFIESSTIPGERRLLHSEKLLDEMSNYYCKLRRDPIVKQADIIMLITRRKLGDINSDDTISDGTVGIANLGGACNPCLKCGIVEDDDSYVDRDDTFAHESAHLIGIDHDGEDEEDGSSGSPTAVHCPSEDGYIMGDDTGANKMKFSSCSREHFIHFLWSFSANCLFDNCYDDRK
ncbi:venom metalloproteinase antarease-like TtrivMP_A [Centruroides sculpturatus]|uniref:venom metalloproteinase antarease-like TtrivMP_A n=1 Tax=Centruroides sculpturatus TaxID=218467 RepID=UPI000C6CC8A8|nr:venom metalloproteinase antarease-like TtrivMP_A [Centruroides sculpturatus]